jgi:hypothetical protein
MSYTKIPYALQEKIIRYVADCDQPKILFNVGVKDLPSLK